MDTAHDDVTQEARRPAGRRGFTLLELIVVLTVVGIVIATVTPRIGKAVATQAVVQARDGLVSMAAFARATALERGTPVALVVDPITERLETVVVSDNSVIRTRDLGDDGVDVETESGVPIKVCYAARGWAIGTGCSDVLPASVLFHREDQTTVATIQLLGQVERQ